MFRLYFEPAVSIPERTNVDEFLARERMSQEEEASD